ncbi:MAG TPA: C4-dicarboxylate ABC transporter permease [Sphaerochaeta sp.]|nr:MAG: C4-dicarboxylate ABC transporter permease [Spirochaetes bacterium GWC2_52_13]HCG62573.1 C4-dicarboxylate ABC transporter permease [Sphaerochaeta sp.]HCS37034.1 C4-dicarboxylate ABC transporter permease [Sphaerochaeta sp.]
MREIKGWMKWLVSICLVGVALFHLYTAIFGVFQPRIQRGIHLMVLLPMAFLLYPATKKSPKDRPSIFDMVFALISVVPPIYLMFMNDALNMRLEMFDPVSPLQTLLGWINIILIIEAVRRTVVPAMAILIGIFFVYIFTAPWLGGIFYSKPLALGRIAEMNYLVTSDGIYGSIVGVTATFVAVFVIFGAFMQNTKTGEYFTNLAVSLAGKSAGGPAKIAVISSGLFGSISGVAAANVYATGVFTIPLMKRLGYRAQFAGAVESAASTGGLLMPPIMGAGAFVMSEITGIAYVHIIKAALLGAIFYYLSILIRVHFVAKKEGLVGMDKDEVISRKQILKDSYQLIPLIVLVILLVVGYSPFIAAVYGILATFLLTFLNRETMMTPAKLWNTFELSGKNLIMLGVSCAGAGMVISIVTNTGLALGIASVIQSWSGGVLLPALLLIMITSILMGMGMPCTPAYIVAVTIGGPALQAMGIDVLTAHLFVFYFAILAEITPPVSIASYCGAAIAGSDPLKTGFEAMRMAIVGFIIPYIFVFNPALMLNGSALEVITLIIIVMYAVVTLASAFRGYLHRILNKVERALMGLLAAALIVVSCNLFIMHNLAFQIAILASAALIVLLFVLAKIKLSKGTAIAA